MDATILISLAAAVLLILISIAIFLRKPNQSKEDDKVRRAAPNRVQREGGAVNRRAQLGRNRNTPRGRQNAAAPAEQEQRPVADEDEDGQLADGLSKVGAKKRAKLEAKAEKKAQREAEEQSREEKKKKERLAEEERRLIEGREQAEEKRIEDEAKKAREEKEKAEHEEYMKMKAAFSVEEEGFEENEAESEQNLLQEFVKYIKDNKVVVIEDLAAHFKLKTQSCIDRIKDLQKDDILTGVIDDRGKFIYISVEEINAVAKFIKQRGRVSIAELAENSNTLICLTPVSSI